LNARRSSVEVEKKFSCLEKGAGKENRGRANERGKGLTLPLKKKTRSTGIRRYSDPYVRKKPTYQKANFTKPSKDCSKQRGGRCSHIRTEGEKTGKMQRKKFFPRASKAQGGGEKSEKKKNLGGWTVRIYAQRGIGGSGGQGFLGRGEGDL